MQDIPLPKPPKNIAAWITAFMSVAMLSGGGFWGTSLIDRVDELARQQAKSNETLAVIETKLEFGAENKAWRQHVDEKLLKLELQLERIRPNP